MCDDDHGHALCGERAHSAQYLARELGVEGGGRLVKEHDVGLHGKGARDGDALLLSARELARVVVLAVGESDLGEQFTCVGENLLFALPLDVAGCLDQVFDDGHMGEEVELLKDHARGHEDAAHVGVARVCCRRIAFLRPAESFSIDRDVAAVDRLEFVDAAQECGLARPRGADDGKHLAAREAEVDAAQDAKLTEGFMNAAHGEHRLVSCCICHSMPPAF